MPRGLTRWDPFAELSSMQDAMDRMFEQGFGRAPAHHHHDGDGNAVGFDVIEKADSYVVEVALPGVDPSDVDISVDDDVLTIKGEFKRESKDEQGERYLHRELHWGSYSRSLALPPDVEAEEAHADFHHGLLELTIPKRRGARTRSFKISSGNGYEMNGASHPQIDVEQSQN